MAFFFNKGKILSDYRIIWVDTETTGLDTDNDLLLEVAIVVTDFDLNIVAELPVWVIHQPNEVLDNMDPWCKTTHGKSKLIDEVKKSTTSIKDFEEEALYLLSKYTQPKKCSLAGNSIGFDRAFLKRLTPKLHDHFYYRNIDISTIYELAKRWYPDVKKRDKDDVIHRAKDDILDSINFLRYYRKAIFVKDLIDVDLK